MFFLLRQVNRDQLYIGRILIGLIMVLQVVLNHFCNYLLMFVIVVPLILNTVLRFFIVVLVKNTLLFSTNTSFSFSGIGRSGTFVLVDSMLKMVKIEHFKICKSLFSLFQLAHTTNPSEISLIDILAHIRTQRPGLIQTAEQLR